MAPCLTLANTRSAADPLQTNFWTFDMIGFCGCGPLFGAVLPPPAVPPCPPAALTRAYLPWAFENYPSLLITRMWEVPRLRLPCSLQRWPTELPRRLHNLQHSPRREMQPPESRPILPPTKVSLGHVPLPLQPRQVQPFRPSSCLTATPLLPRCCKEPQLLAEHTFVPDQVVADSARYLGQLWRSELHSNPERSSDGHNE